ncbi:surface-adhesin E family protein [Cupriavidus necator]|uniref:surface-adhesin E family protein n=1 Tax=Cupriavidus necator TaxID=106590 RepID=UPI003F73C5DE
MSGVKAVSSAGVNGRKGERMGMGRSLRYAVIAALLGWVQLSDAATWVTYAETESVTLQYDSSTVTRSGAKVTYWEKAIPKTEEMQRLYAAGTPDPSRITLRVSNGTIDCAARRLYPLSAKNYDGNGMPIGGFDGNPEGMSAAIAPESTIDALRGILCKSPRRK